MPAKDLKSIAIAAVAAITVMTLMALAVPVFAAPASIPRLYRGVAPHATSPNEMVADPLAEPGAIGQTPAAGR